MKQKPDAEEFAKGMLWRLANIQADVYQNELLLVEILARLTQQNSRDIQARWKTDRAALIKRIYSESLNKAGLQENDSGQTPGQSDSRMD